ncbi:MAG: type VI secretion system baseplate subunit TssG [Nitrospirae bacterium]|nr:type VI secretion system baseplate subunit TssG [Nitrospirota bacterium]
MGPAERQSGASLTDRLFKEFYRFSFFKAVGLLEDLFPGKKPIGKTLDPGEEAVRFSSKTGLAFPASDISKMEHKEKDSPVDMEVTFMGLIGPSGVLPHWYNEQAVERIYNKDFGLTAFYDIFHHRLISLFYLAWKKHKLSATYQPDANDKISSCFLNLAGLGTPRLLDLLDINDRSTVYYYSGLLSRQSPSAVAIEAAAGYFAEAQAHVQQFVEQLLPISPEDQTQIGRANSQLGVNTVCGGFFYESKSKFRVRLGPMGFENFRRLLPTGDVLGPAFSMIKYMTGVEHEFDISLILKREEVPSCVLGQGALPPMLGWTAWVKSEGVMPQRDPCVVFEEKDVK